VTFARGSTFKVIDSGQNVFKGGIATVTVIPKNDPPTPIQVPHIKIDQGEASKPVTISVNDPDKNDVYTISVFKEPEHGKAELIDGNKIRYTPSREWYGNDQITVIAENQDGETVKGDILVTVKQVKKDGLSDPYERFRYRTLIGAEFSQGNSSFSQTTPFVQFSGSTLWASAPFLGGGSLNGSQFSLFGWKSKEKNNAKEYVPGFLSSVDLRWSQIQTQDQQNTEFIDAKKGVTASLGLEQVLLAMPARTSLYPQETKYRLLASVIANGGLQTVAEATDLQKARGFFNTGLRFSERERMKNPFYTPRLRSYMDLTYGWYGHLPSGARKKFGLEGFLEFPSPKAPIMSVAALFGGDSSDTTIMMRFSYELDPSGLFNVIYEALPKFVSEEGESSEKGNEPIAP
jgi:hypothetical protein